MGSGRKDSSSVTGRMRRDIIITAPKESSKPMLYSAVGSARSMTMALKAIPEGMSYRLPAAAAYRLQRLITLARIREEGKAAMAQ